MAYQSNPLEYVPGIQSTEDFTPQSTSHYVAGDKVRFVDGFPEKIGGWDTLTISGDLTINGCPRNIYSYILNNSLFYLVGTHTNLYLISGNSLDNVTPLSTTSVAVNNAFQTEYTTLGNDPFSVTDGSMTVTVTDTAHPFVDGDIISIAGAVGFAGIPAGDFNAQHSIGNLTTNTYDITVATNANTTTTGGGAVVDRSSRIITVTQAAHGYAEGDNVGIDNTSADVGGVLASQIDGTYTIRRVTTNTYNIDNGDAFATSSASGGGNADIFPEVPNGVCDPTLGFGYGLGLYGMGLYGVGKTATAPTLPSIWSFDRFGDLIVFTQDNQTGLYSWAGAPGVLPELVTNAPTAIDYVFVTNNIAVTLGASGIGNRIQWSDQGNLTTWTPTAENQAGQDDIEGASDFLSHARLRGTNLLFTNDQVYTFRYVGKPFVFETQQLDPGIGLIARNARVVVNGICYWMSRDNFYWYKGGNPEIIPSNTISQSTVKNFVFNNINVAQESKIFAWYNDKFNEIWWHYPSGASDECDRVVTYNIRTNVWGTHTLDRTAAEYPNVLGVFPYLIDFDGVVYRHENGTDDDTAALEFSLTTPFKTSGSFPISVGGVYFDSIRNEDITLTLNTKRYPKSDVSTSSYTVADTTDKIVFKRRGRYWQYTISGNELGQAWRGGQWFELVRQSGKR